MSSAFDVKWTKTAREDLRQIIEYVKNRNPNAAVALLHEIKGQVFELDRMAERWRIVPELQVHGVFQFRELIVSHWRIIYKIMAATVFVMAVLDSRRNLEDLLLQRMLGRGE